MAYGPPRERDAWFVIRGFVYQVQLTIERWLQLGADEKLALECGEDIDLVAGWSASDESTERLLEQVKHRNSSLTLNSPEARTALANFVEHIEANPGQKLAFRFVTNATAGMEKKPALPKQWVGINVWNELRQGNHKNFSKLRRVAALRGVLRRGSRPSDTPEGVWDKYQRFVGSAGSRQMDRLILQFEWSVGHEDAVELRPSLESRLAIHLKDSDVGFAKNAYERLFSHVFEILSKQGTKILTRGDLDIVLGDTNYRRNHALERLTEAVEELRNKVDRATGRLDVHEASIEAIKTQVTSLARANGMTGEFHNEGPAPSLLTPPAPATIAPRDRIVNSILSRLINDNWVALIGTSGSGKSEIARQVSEAFDGPVHWLSLRDLNESQSCAHFANAFSSISEEPRRENWQEKLVLRLKGTLVVLDDLPRFDVNSQLGRALLPFVVALKTHGVSLITTSPYELSGRVLGLSLVTSLPVPEFDESETRQLLVAFGAPDTPSLDAWARVVTVSTSGHAELVVTAAAHLRRLQWDFSEEKLQGLLSRSSEAEIRSDVLRRVSATTSNEAERELLYRAALISGSFCIEDLRVVAQVERPVVHADAVLANLEGLWVQPQGGGRFAICPLARQLSDQLEPAVKKGVHGALGLSYMRRKSLGPIEVISAIAHFIGAEEFDRAGVAYLHALSSVDRQRLPAFDAGLFLLWSDSSLPEKMSLGIRIYIRTLQLGIQHVLKKSTDFLIDDLMVLASAVDDSEVSFLTPVAMHLPVILGRDFDGGSRAITRLVASLDSLSNPLGKPLDKGLTDSLRSFLWHQTAVARTPATVRACLRSFGAIPTRILQSSASGEAYEMGAVGLCDGIWISQFERPSEVRDWNEVWALLDEIAETAEVLQLSLLNTAARRTQIIIAAEVQKNLDAALQIARTVLPAHNEIETFLVRECIGRQLLYAGRYAEGLEHLKAATETSFRGLSSYRFYAQLALAEAYSHSDSELALEATHGALSIAREVAQLPRLELVKALGEVAVAVYRHSGARDAFPYINEAARLLFQNRRESPQWRDVHVLLAHASAYLQSIASTGRPPSGRTVTGDDFAEPKTGIFLKHHDERSNLYSKEGEVAFRICLALFANTLDQEDAMTFWVASIQGDEGAPVMHTLAVMFQSVDLVAEERFVEAVNLTARIKDSDIGVFHLSFVLSAKIAGIALENQARAQVIAREVGSLVCAYAVGRLDAKTWHQLGRLLEIGLSPDFDKADVAQLLQEPGTHDLAVLCGLVLTSTRPGESPVAALSAHVGLAMRAHAQKQVFMSAHRRVVLPTITGFWQKFVAQSRFLLRGPDLVVDELNRAVGLPPSIRAQEILRVMVNGLGVQVPADVRSWLQGKVESLPKQ